MKTYAVSAIFAALFAMQATYADSQETITQSVEPGQYIIDLSTLTFTNEDDIVPASGTAEIANTGVANTLAGNDEITGNGDYHAITNNGTIDTGNGNDEITGNGGTYGIVTGAPFTTSGGIINTGDGNDTITGTGTSTGGGSGIALYGAGTINTGNGDDTINATGSYDGLTNNGDTIDTGNGNDTVIGNAIGVSGNGITNSGTIKTGTGDDIIIGSAIGAGVGIMNGTGIIDTGAGDDMVDALKGGFGGFNGIIGIFLLGKGDDVLKGFGSGRFDGGDGEDTLLFGPGTYTISGSTNGDGFFTIISNGITDMLVKNFERIGSASNPANHFSFSNMIGRTFTL